MTDARSLSDTMVAIKLVIACAIAHVLSSVAIVSDAAAIPASHRRQAGGNPLDLARDARQRAAIMEARKRAAEESKVHHAEREAKQKAMEKARHYVHTKDGRVFQKHTMPPSATQKPEFDWDRQLELRDALLSAIKNNRARPALPRSWTHFQAPSHRLE